MAGLVLRFRLLAVAFLALRLDGDRSSYNNVCIILITYPFQVHFTVSLKFLRECVIYPEFLAITSLAKPACCSIANCKTRKKKLCMQYVWLSKPTNIQFQSLRCILYVKKKLHKQPGIVYHVLTYQICL